MFIQTILTLNQHFFLCCLLFFTACSGPNRQSPSNLNATQDQTDTSQYVWTKLLDSAEWRKSYNYQMFTLKDTLWVFHYDGVWYSTNGKNWTKSPLPNAVGNLAFASYVPFKNAVYGLGHFKGNFEQLTFNNVVFKTTNFRYWDTISKENNLPRRFFYHPFVFDRKIWLIGGEDKSMQYSDSWNSANGVHWVQQKTDLPFGRRSRSWIVQFKTRLFLLNNDVWSSADGLTWQKECDEILKGENIFGYTPVVFDNQIWLLGCNRNGKFSSQVMVSPDGKRWKSLHAPWSPRGAVAAAVYKNKIYLTGGKYGGFTQNGNTTEFVYSNDVWMCEKKQ